MTEIRNDDGAERIGGRAPSAWLGALSRIASLATGSGATLPEMVADYAAQFPERPALISDGSCLTYGSLGRRIDAYARWALLHDVGIGDVVCLLMPNRPDYVAIWLGLTSVRAVVALINTNLNSDALLHAVTAVAPKHLIVDASLADTIDDIRHRLPADLQTWVHGNGSAMPRIDAFIERLDDPPLRRAADRSPRPADRALYIYTSGTTGLPKAASVSHRRIMEWSCWFAGMMDVGPGDRMYDCLPLYHSTGGVVATGSMLVSGASVVIRPKFSTRSFWNDVDRYECTLFQYIGELCRYLLAGASHPLEATHRLRLCVGNGLSADVWTAFQERFRIPRILEFYASTEGNFSLYNVEEQPGAIGRIPPFLAHRYPVALVKCDVDTGAPIRNGEGFCIPCATGEPGEALGRIAGTSDGSGKAAGRPFEGYADRAASDAKILCDVFAAGDAWFRTGDLMRRDGAGFFYFVDRLGDSFRWKGENVSAAEVANVLRAAAAVIEAVVYGVTIPGTEGRAGMAALHVGEAFDVRTLQNDIEGRLPAYARPMFLRIQGDLAMTGTFRPVTASLKRDGFDPSRITDPLYFMDPVNAAYMPLDTDVFARIVDGALRL